MSKPQFAFWELLKSESVLTLATGGKVGGCWSAPVLYAAHRVDDRPVLYFLSSPSSWHINHSDGAVGGSIYANYTGDWQAIRGLQMQGSIAEVSQNNREHWQSVYFARFPEVAEIINSPQSEQQQKIAAAFTNSGYYCFAPSYIRATDNSQQFASHQSWDFT